ncbi:MAG TPA: Hsp20/alpha crystallin family protein [Albitalea sp.]|uniref:Hsp20/alpha crystallin family protein n=1 Tax=Piscinibacter sp. TaxID=1903157 RepID=UPI002ED60ED4
MVPSLMSFPGDVFADFDALQRQIDRLLGNRPFNASIRAVERGSFPAVNIGTTADAVEIFAFAPGIDMSKLDVTVDKGLLTIAGERRRQVEGGAKQTVYASERPAGSFRRVVSLPEDADPDRVNATYTNGVLRIQVQKREASKPRRIEVKDAR